MSNPKKDVLDVATGGLTATPNPLTEPSRVNDSDKQSAKATQNLNDDVENRREATYRQDRDALISSLGQYYAANGMKSPFSDASALPGAGTSRRLPNEGALYNNPGAEIPDDPNTYQANTPPAPTGTSNDTGNASIDDSTSTQQADNSSKGSANPDASNVDDADQLGLLGVKNPMNAKAAYQMRNQS